MRDFIKKEYPWFLANALWFWCLPLVGGALNSADQTGFYLLLMMIGNPFFCMISGLFYGMKRGRKWRYLLYPAICGIVSMLMYYNTSAFAFIILAVCCSLIGMIFGGWSRGRRMTEAEKWSEKSGLPASYFEDKKKEPPKAQDEARGEAQAEVRVRVPSKTALKNQQKAYARKAKERAEKEAKLKAKDAPKKKKKGGH